jgi:hypothetical protein
MAKSKDIVPLHMNAVLWKALSTIVSTDETRMTLTCVHVRSARIFEVTDGHCAIQVTLDSDTSLLPGLYDPKATLARVKAGVEPVTHPVEKFNAKDYPNFDLIMREPIIGYTERCDVGLDPRLVSRVNDAAADILSAVTGAKGFGLIWSVESDLDAVIIHGKAPDVRIRAVIMPMRVEGPRKRPEKDTFDADSLKAAEKRAVYLDSVVADLRAEIVRLTADLNDAREAADTDAADALRANQAADELRAEVNALRHLRPKGDVVAPILLSNPIVRA